MAKFTDALKTVIRSVRFRILLPFFSYEVNLNDIVDSATVDERIAKLGEIKRDLEAAIVAVESLQGEAEARKVEADSLRNTVQQLNEERTTAEALLRVPEESFVTLLTRANSKGRWRGIMEGVMVGFVTGVLSSFVVWYFTR